MSPSRRNGCGARSPRSIPHDVKVYPGSGHHFLSEASGAGAVLARFARMSYQKADAADAWQRIYTFFGKYLEDNRAG